MHYETLAPEAQAKSRLRRDSDEGVAKRGPLPGVFDLRRELGRAPTVEEFRQSRGFDR